MPNIHNVEVPLDPTIPKVSWFLLKPYFENGFGSSFIAMM